MGLGVGLHQLRMKKHYLWASIALSLNFLGCKDQPEQIPAYLEIKPFTVNAEGGTDWQKITEAYVYVNREYLGAYSLPASVPVLAAGEALVYAYPGVKENGILSTPNIYPFLLRHTQTVTLTGGQSMTIQPTTSYDPDTRFPWALDRTTFDGSSSIVFQNRDSDENSNYTLSADGAFSGRSLLMQVDSLHSSMLIATEPVVLPTDKRQVWLELQYKNDVVFEAYLLGKTGAGPERTQALFLFNKKEEWNKIYLNLTDLLVQSQEENYRIGFFVSLPRNEAGKFTQTAGSVRIDNLRLANF